MNELQNINENDSISATGMSGHLLFAALARPCNAFKTLLHAVPWYALGLADWGISWHRQRLLTNVIGVGSAFGGDNWGHQHLNRPQYLAQQTTRRGLTTEMPKQSSGKIWKSDGLTWSQSGNPPGPLGFARKYRGSLTLDASASPVVFSSGSNGDVTEAKC